MPFTRLAKRYEPRLYELRPAYSYTEPYTGKRTRLVNDYCEARISYITYTLRVCVIYGVTSLVYEPYPS